MTEFPIRPAYNSNNHAFVLESSEEYSPYLSVTLQSLINHAVDSRNYDILILTFDITPSTEQMLIHQADGKDNISVRVYHCKEYLKQFIQTKEDAYGGAVYMRLCLPELLEGYTIIAHIDSDMIIAADVADALYEYDMSNWCICAASDIYANIHSRIPYWPAKYFTDDMIYQRLGLRSMKEYINGGFVIYNIPELRRCLPLDTLLEFSMDDRLKYKDQDAFSHFLQGKILNLSMEWNWPTNSDRYIDRYKGYMEQGDSLLSEYEAAAKNVKIYHYVAGAAKPWKNACVPYADLWWETAASSPVFDMLFAANNGFDCADTTTDAGKGKLVRAQSKGRLLFIAETYYDLICSLNIKLHYFRDDPADLIITSSTRLADKIEGIKRSNLFENIFVSTYNASVDVNRIREAKDKALVLNPEKYDKMIQTEAVYTDYFMPCASSPYQKMVFYMLENSGIIPRVHLYEDGMENYVESIEQGIARDGLLHGARPVEERFVSNVVNQYLYLPEAYSANAALPTMKIPTIKREDTEFCAILTDIFGSGRLPEEKYIFFNECFAEELRVSTEINTLDRIAQRVGKENIIVKTHPRALKADSIYRINGYKLFEEDGVPWEIYMLDEGMKDKVLVTISSVAPLTSYLNFKKPFFTIYLDRIMTLSKRAHASKPTYDTFQTKMKSVINTGRKLLFTPGSMKELEFVLDYIEEGK